jgi:hypothetical protein
MLEASDIWATGGNNRSGNDWLLAGDNPGRVVWLHTSRHWRILKNVGLKTTVAVGVGARRVL